MVFDLISPRPCRRRPAKQSALRSSTTIRAALAEPRAEFPRPRERTARPVLRQAWPRRVARPRAQSLCQPLAMLECRAAAAERYQKTRAPQSEYFEQLLPCVAEESCNRLCAAGPTESDNVLLHSECCKKPESDSNAFRLLGVAQFDFRSRCPGWAALRNL